jgi:hypothetical protein
VSLIRLGVDRQNHILAGVSGAASQIPDMFQGNSQDFEIAVYDPAALGNYTKQDMAGSGLRVSVGDTPTGTSGGPTPLAIQTVWTWNATTKVFTGTLALNTVAIDAFIGTAASKQAYFEINVTDGSGNRQTILQVTFNLKAVVDEQTSTTPTPTDQYLTKSEMLALFAKLIGDAGKTQVFKSPGAIYGREIGVNDDGTRKDDVILL